MTLCQHIIKGAAYLTTGPCKKYSSCGTNGDKGGASVKKKKLTEKLTDCIASAKNVEEFRILVNLFLFFFCLFFCTCGFHHLRRSLGERQEFQEAAPDGSFKSFVCYCLMIRQFRRHIWMMKILTLPSAVDSSHCSAH